MDAVLCCFEKYEYAVKCQSFNLNKKINNNLPHKPAKTWRKLGTQPPNFCLLSEAAADSSIVVYFCL